MTATNEEILGRADANDLEAILSITNTEVDAVMHAVTSNPEAIFTWDYERSRPALVKLYEKAKTSQWNGETDLPWDTDVDQEKVVLANATAAAADSSPSASMATAADSRSMRGSSKPARAGFRRPCCCGRSANAATTVASASSRHGWRR